MQLYAALAEKERALISTRTKAALAAKKMAGAKLGNPRAAEAASMAHATNRAAADQFAGNVLPVVREIQTAGITSLGRIAAALNARGIRTARGGPGTRQQFASPAARARIRAGNPLLTRSVMPHGAVQEDR